MSGEETEFPIALRGYERSAVEDALRDIRKDLMRLSAQNAQLVQELKETSAAREQAEAQIAEADNPTYSGVGARAALILSTAEDQAATLLTEANQQAAKLRAQLESEIEALHGEAKGYYDSLVAEAQRRADRIMTSARADYDEILNQAHNEGARITEEATREAGSIRGAISTEVAKMRANAKREVESLKAKVERNLAEQKLMTFRDIARGVDIDSAHALISEQARIDLELELTARRAEAEADYLDKHQRAVAATQKYLDDANAQLSNALIRANAARLEAETLQAAAISINQQTKSATRKKADAIIAAAEAEARQVIAAAQKSVEQKLAEARISLEKIEAERDSVEVYLRNLRNVLSVPAQKTQESGQ